MNQSPAAGLVRFKVVELCDVTGRIRDRAGLHRVELGNTEPVGFMTGGAPHRIWLQKAGGKLRFDLKIKTKLNRGKWSTGSRRANKKV